MISVQNNTWGISTSYSEQHGEEQIADRGKAFGIRTRVINGNDPMPGVTKSFAYMRGVLSGMGLSEG